MKTIVWVGAWEAELPRNIELVNRRKIGNLPRHRPEGENPPVTWFVPYPQAEKVIAFGGILAEVPCHIADAEEFIGSLGPSDDAAMRKRAWDIVEELGRLGVSNPRMQCTFVP